MWMRYARKAGLLVLGTGVSAVGIVLMLRANIGLEPWSALQQGLELTVGFSFGFASVVVGLLAIGVAMLFGEHFGFGTIANIVFCGLFIDVLIALDWIPEMHALLAGIPMLLGGLEILTIGTWLYMLAELGTGPRDALMVALAKKTGRSVGLCRATVELLCVLAGFLMGARIGVGTVISALGVGALFNLNFHLLHFKAAELQHENVAETLRNLSGRGNAKAEDSETTQTISESETPDVKE